MWDGEFEFEVEIKTDRVRIRNLKSQITNTKSLTSNC
jgi:hypothetical protein